MAFRNCRLFSAVVRLIVFFMICQLLHLSAKSVEARENVISRVRSEKVRENLIVVSFKSISSYTCCGSGISTRRMLLFLNRTKLTRRSSKPSIGLFDAVILVLALSGDVEINPGPTTHSLTCLVCDAKGRKNQLFIKCNGCAKLAHRICASLSATEYRKIRKGQTPWHCWCCFVPNFSDSFFEVDGSCHQNTSIREDYIKHQRQSKLTCLSFNARSISNNKKRPMIQSWLEAVNPDIIVSCETWLNSSISDAEIMPEEYMVFRKDRSVSEKKRRRGRGVLIAIRPEMEPTRITSLETKAEILWVEINCGDSKILLGSAYRAPNANEELVNNELIASLELVQDIQHKYSGIYLCGDFNLSVDWGPSDHVLPENSLADKFVNAFLNVVPHQMVKEATRITNSSRSILDLILTNNPARIEDVEVIPGVSDHMAVKFTLQWQPPKPKVVKRQLLNYKKANWVLLKQLFTVEMTGLIGCNGDMEDVWTRWKEIFWTCVKTAIPQVKVNSQRKPTWINRALIKKIHKQDLL